MTSFTETETQEQGADVDVTRRGWRQEGSLGHTDFGDAVETNTEIELHVQGREQMIVED